MVSIKDLLEAGVHFGHQTQRWNPKMDPYIFTSRKNLHIIDLQKSLKGLKEAIKFVQEISSAGQEILFVGTKKQAQECIEKDAKDCGALFVNRRWLGGTLTNFATIKKRINRLKEIEAMEKEGSLEMLSKKEVSKIRDEKEKLDRFLGGIKEMNKLPGAILIIDTHKEKIAIKEAKKLNVPIVAVADTNCDPDEIDYVIPGNDDAIRAINLFTKSIAEAVKKGKQLLSEKEVAAEEEETLEEIKEVEDEMMAEAEEKIEEEDSEEEGREEEEEGEEEQEEEEVKD